MRTTMDIPEELIEEARRVLGCRSKTEAVILSLKEVVHRARVAELKGLMGSVRLQLDIAKSRRRHPRKA